MTLVLLPVLQILLGDGAGFNDHHVLGITLLSGAGKVVASCNHVLTIDDHDLVMRDGMAIVDQCRNPGMAGIVGRRILLGTIAFVQKQHHIDAAHLRIGQGLQKGGFPHDHRFIDGPDVGIEASTQRQGTYLRPSADKTKPSAAGKSLTACAKALAGRRKALAPAESVLAVPR